MSATRPVRSRASSSTPPRRRRPSRNGSAIAARDASLAPQRTVLSELPATSSRCSPESRGSGNPFRDLVGGILELDRRPPAGTRRSPSGRPGSGTASRRSSPYERAEDHIKVLDQRALERRRTLQHESPRKVLVKLDRNTFVMATGASETELLGDVRHDPYGGHPQLGTLPYERVIAGRDPRGARRRAVPRRAAALGFLQRHILTAMQEKRFPITGRNPQSGGASVRVDNVPCDFILVAAANIQDIHRILSPLRSRIAGSGYEVLLETTMAETRANRLRLAQFCAQEIASDGRIRPATRDAVFELIKEARRRAEVLDGRRNALTLRLRELGGLIRTGRRPRRGRGQHLPRGEPRAGGALAGPFDRGADQGGLRLAPGRAAPGDHRGPAPVNGLLQLERPPRPGPVPGGYG